MKIPVLKGEKRRKARRKHFRTEVREVAIYRAFKENVSNPKSVFYPACGWNISPSKVFENITFVDPNPNVFAILKTCGFDAFWGCIQNYVPEEEHDLLILQGFYTGLIKETLRFVPEEGYILLGPLYSNSLGLSGSMYEEAKIIQSTKRFSCYGEINFVERKNKDSSEVTFTRNLEGKLAGTSKSHRCRKKNRC
ncbi:MAG: hypothetical protein ABIE22_03490 [archaeon]